MSQTEQSTCANMGCYRRFRPAAGKVYHSKRCARLAAERRARADYQAATGKRK
jgi:hypothetical protein